MGLRSVHHMLSLLLLPPHTLPCSSMVSLPRETILLRARQCGSFPQDALFTNCSSVGPSHGVQSFRNGVHQRGSPTGSQALPANLLQHGLLSFHGATGPAKSLLQRGLPMGLNPPSGIHLLRCGVFHALQVDICSTTDLHRLQGLTMVFIMG